MTIERKNDEPKRQRKPYEKPAILYREPLEAVASSCTTSPGKSSPAESCSFSSS